MLDPKLQDALNDQVNQEFQAAHLYLAMSAWFESQNFPGFANWMQHQSAEERGHAMRIYAHVHDRGGRVKLGAISQPPQDFAGPVEAFEQALAHEKKVTASIHHLYELAGQLKDYAAQVMLHWFIDEQVEEEKTATDLVDRLRRVADSPAGLLVLDRQVGERQGE